MMTERHRLAVVEANKRRRGKKFTDEQRRRSSDGAKRRVAAMTLEARRHSMERLAEREIRALSVASLTQRMA